MSSSLFIFFFSKTDPKEYYKDLIEIVAIEEDGPEYAHIWYSSKKDGYIPLHRFREHPENVKKAILEAIDELPKKTNSINVEGRIKDGFLTIDFEKGEMDYYIISIVATYSAFCSYRYETGIRDEPSEEAVEIAKMYTEYLIDVVRGVVRVAQPEFGYGDIDARVDKYLSKLHNEKYKNLREYFADITNGFTTLPWLFVYKDNLNIRIADKVTWYGTMVYTPKKPKIIEKIGECWLYILKDTSVSASW